MKITRKGEYALKALLALAAVYDQSVTLSLRAIAKQENISYKFLEQIMLLLKKTGFVKSVMGKHGGYSLARAPKTVMLGEVIRTIEGPLAPIGTAAEMKKKIQTEGHRHPGLYSILLEVRDAISDILDKKSLADVNEKSLELAGSRLPHEMYHI